MNIELTSQKGLTHTFTVTIPAAEILSYRAEYIKSRAPRVKVQGFRPGKVPSHIIEAQLGEDASNQALRTLLDQAIKKAVKDHNIRQIGEPKIDGKDYKEGEDFSFTLAFETLPVVELKSFDGIELEKLVVEVPEGDVEKSLDDLHKNHKSFQPVEKLREPKEGDRASCELSLKVGNKKLSGYQNVNVTLDMGDAKFMIEGVVDHLKKMKEGESATFVGQAAENFDDPQVAGKAVEVSLTFKKHFEPKNHVKDDVFAKEFGKENLEELKKTLKENLEKNYQGMARLYLKRHLLDELEKLYSFDLPESMVDAEFANIWQQLQAEVEKAKTAGEYDETEDKPEEEMRAEYRKIAERRVRLGLVISEVSRAEKVQITQEEVRGALYREALRYPGQEKQVMQYFRNNPQAIDRMVAPLLEDKVVDHIATKIKTKDVKVDVKGLKKKVKGVVPTLFDEDASNEVA